MSNDIPDVEDLSIPSSVDDQSSKCVEKNQLRALVLKWRNRYAGESALPEWESGDHHGHEKCAQELEQVLDDV